MYSMLTSLSFFVYVINSFIFFLCICVFFFFFFFSSRRRHTRWTGDWSSDVCSSDLPLAVLLEDAGLADRLSIIERALDDDVAEPLEERAVRITIAIGECVMLAMARHPFLGDDRGRQPEPDAHRHLGELAESHAPVRLCAMEEERHADVGQMTSDDHEQNWLPPVRCPTRELWHRSNPCSK